jgi:hypothetical protein
MLPESLQPISIALLPGELGELIRIIRDDYRAAAMRQNFTRLHLLDRLLRKLGDDRPIDLRAP